MTMCPEDDQGRNSYRHPACRCTQSGGDRRLCRNQSTRYSVLLSTRNIWIMPLNSWNTWIWNREQEFRAAEGYPVRDENAGKDTAFNGRFFLVYPVPRPCPCGPVPIRHSASHCSDGTGDCRPYLPLLLQDKSHNGQKSFPAARSLKSSW